MHLVAAGSIQSFGTSLDVPPFAYEVEIETGKSRRRCPSLAGLRPVIHAVVVGIIVLARKGLVDAASVSGDPFLALAERGGFNALALSGRDHCLCCDYVAFYSSKWRPRYNFLS